MAIVWGAYQNNVRLGVDIIMSPEPLTAATTQVTLTVGLYAQTAPGASLQGNWQLSYTGNWSGGARVPVNLGSGAMTRLHIAYIDYPLTGSARTVTFGAGLQHYFGHTSVSRSFTIPARLAQLPGAPYGLSASYVSDQQINFSWSNGGGQTSLVVFRQVDDSTSWDTVATLSGSATSFTDRGVQPGHRYRYGVHAYNAAGSRPDNGATSWVYTTPTVPSSVHAARNGVRVTVDARVKPRWVDSYDVMDGTTVVASNVKLPWVHANANMDITHLYKVRAKVGGRVSAWSDPSDVLQAAKKPNPPANLSPNGNALVRTQPARFSWRHNPTDESAQTAYTFKWRVPGATSWNTSSGTTSSEFVEFPSPASTFGTANRIEWVVQTRGAHSTYSNESPVATAQLVNPPSIRILDQDKHPIPATDMGQPLQRVWLAWDNTQFAPVDWTVTLVDVETGEEWAYRLNRRETAYREYAQYGHDLRSNRTYQIKAFGVVPGTDLTVSSFVQFVTKFDPPAAAVVDVSFNEPDAVVGVHWSTPGGTPAAVAHQVERTEDGGKTWTLLVPRESGRSGFYVDRFAALGVDVTYRVTTFSSRGAATVREVTLNTAVDYVLLTGGAGFTNTVRLTYSPRTKVEAGRKRTNYTFSGRPLPVAYAGGNIARTVEYTGVIYQGLEDVTVEQLTDLFQVASPVHLYRDPDGRKIFGTVSNITVDRRRRVSGGAEWIVEFTLTETDSGVGN